ncbi:hypothetical protein FHS13_001390 [Nocardiopsis algeriensis]|uniref:Uncharacterized protein n=1 Tax=Nocardiopsis algeriensis TaxID=1478215 RepID=A0A841IT55_9ACTN|nr:hypothetical protein [Nocardiopsis algeriensis]
MPPRPRSDHDHARADDAWLAEVAERARRAAT